MSNESSTSDSPTARRVKGSSQRAAARASRSKGSSRGGLFLRIALVLVIVAACGGLTWWAIKPAAVDEAAVAPEASTQSTTLPLFDRVAVSGRVGATPTIDIKAPLDIDGFKARVIEEGNGREITEGSPVLVAITAFDAASGRMLSESGRPQMSLGIIGSDQISSARHAGHRQARRLAHPGIAYHHDRRRLSQRDGDRRRRYFAVDRNGQVG